jgi:hypothetical protein
MQNESPSSDMTLQPDTPSYETAKEHRDNPPPEYEEHKLGSMRLGHDPLDAVANDPAGVPAAYVVADVRPRAVIPAEGIPPETNAVNYITPEGMPKEFRPREVLPAEGR